MARTLTVPQSVVLAVVLFVVGVALVASAGELSKEPEECLEEEDDDKRRGTVDEPASFNHRSGHNSDSDPCNVAPAFMIVAIGVALILTSVCTACSARAKLAADVRRNMASMVEDGAATGHRATGSKVAPAALPVAGASAAAGVAMAPIPPKPEQTPDYFQMMAALGVHYGASVDGARAASFQQPHVVAVAAGAHTARAPAVL